MKTFILFVSLLSIAALADTTDDQWEFRGYQAAKKMGEVTKKDKLDTSDVCQMVLESAYALHLDPKTKDIVKKSNKAGLTVRSLIFRNDKEFTQLGFVYEKGKTAPMGWKGLKLADGYEFLSLSANPGTVSIGSEKCMFVFKVNEPTKGVAIAVENDKK